MYGGSMGGYAAVKFSRAFGATTVIAFCPQWSIDKAECGPIDPGWGLHFVPGMRNMGIRREDVSGRVYVFLDRFDKTDDFHGIKISSAYPRTTLVNVPMCGHHVTSVLAGTQSLRNIVESCRKNDISALPEIIAPARREHHFRKIQVLERSFDKRPKTVSRIVQNRANDPAIQAFIAKSYAPLVNSLLARQGIEQTADFIRVAVAFISPLRNKLNAMSLLSQLADESIFLTTYADTLVLYDSASGRCRHATRDEFTARPYRFAPITIRVLGKTAFLTADLGGIEYGLYPDKNSLLTGFLPPPGPDAWHVTLDEAGNWLSLSYDGQFLCAQPGGELVCNRPTAQTWEKFTFSLVPRPRPGTAISR